MTGVLFAFAFVGALVIGFVAGVLFARYTRFRHHKEHKKAKGDLTEQLRLLTDTIGHRSDRLGQEEKYVQAAANQADFMQPWYQSRHQSGMYSDRLHPQSMPDQTINYQDWAIPFGNNLSLYQQPRVVNLPPMHLPPDIEIDGPKGEWPHSTINNNNINEATASSSPSGSASDINEFERRQPQMQEDGQGEDSLFDISSPSHNPHVTSVSMSVS